MVAKVRSSSEVPSVEQSSTTMTWTRSRWGDDSRESNLANEAATKCCSLYTGTSTDSDVMLGHPTAAKAQETKPLWPAPVAEGEQLVARDAGILPVTRGSVSGAKKSHGKRSAVVDMSREAISARLHEMARLSAERGPVSKDVDMSSAAISARLRTMASLSDLCRRLAPIGRRLTSD